MDNIINVSDLLIKWGFVRIWSNQIRELIIGVVGMIKALVNSGLELKDYEVNIILGTVKLAVINNNNNNNNNNDTN